MREETFKVYKYQELSDAAKDNAYQKFVESDYRETHWVDESLESLKAFLAWLGLKITDYSICPYTQSYIDTDIPEDCQEEIRLKSVEYRLLGLDIPEMEDRLEEDFDPAALLIEWAEFNFPATCKTVGAYNQGWGTGYCMDDDIIHHWNNHLREHPLDHIGALHAVVDGALKSMVEDMEYQDSKENFEELESCYENEYLEDGTQHH
jgi:hypothetical protein